MGESRGFSIICFVWGSRRFVRLFFVLVGCFRVFFFSPDEHGDAALPLQGAGFGRDAVLGLFPCLCVFLRSHPCWILPPLLCAGSFGRGRNQTEVIIDNCESDPIWAGLENHPRFSLLLLGIQLECPFLWSANASSIPLEPQKSSTPPVPACSVCGGHGECSSKAGCARSISFLAAVGEKKSLQNLEINRLSNCVGLRKRCRIEIISSRGGGEAHHFICPGK